MQWQKIIKDQEIILFYFYYCFYNFKNRNFIYQADIQMFMYMLEFIV